MKTHSFHRAAVALLAALLGVGALAAPTALGQPANVDPSLKPQQSFNDGVYRNEDFGFSFSLPDNWRGIDDPRLPSVIFVGLREQPEGESFNPNVTLGVEIVSDGVDSRQYAGHATRALETAGWRLRGERAVQWGGREAYEIRAVKSSNDSDESGNGSESDVVQLVQRFVVLKNGAVVLAATARPQQMKTMGEEFQAIFESFKVASAD